jgi:exosortase
MVLPIRASLALSPFMTSAAARERGILVLAAVSAVCGFLLFQFLGSSTRGYIPSASLFYWWGFQWFNPGSDTQHGILILGISVWLVSRNLGFDASATSSRSAVLNVGAAAMVAGLLLHALGFVAEQARLSIIGLLVYIWGVIALAGGRRWARASMFPVAFMVFAIPLNALDSIGFWLRMWVVGTSGPLLHAVGIGVLVNGTQLLSPNGRYDYDVAAACSGVRSLVALSALCLLMGYLRFRKRWLLGVIFASCFPLIYVGNVVRIMAIVIAAQMGGQAWGDRVHEVMGFVVFAIVLGGAIALTETVARLRPGWTHIGRRADSGSARTTHAGGADGPPWLQAAFVGLAMAICAGVIVHASRTPPTSRSGIELAKDGLNPVPLPEFLGSDWMGRRSEVSAIEREVLPGDTGYSRKIYVSLSDPSKQVFLSIVLSGRDRTSIHRPEYCLVGQGWTIRSSFAHEFRFPGKPGGFPATVLRVERESVTPQGRVKVPQLFAYYFVGMQTVVATHWERMASDAFDRVVRGNGDRWAYVVVQTGDADGEEAALRRMQTILDGTLPVFQKLG